MRAINHAMTGAVIGFVVTNPVIALPLAFVSHFVQDAIPHHDDEERFPLNSRPFTGLLLLDATLCLLLVAALSVASPTNWLIPAVCAFLATSPDFMWIPRYIIARRTGKDPGPKGLIQDFHTLVQWFVWPGGVWVEAIWAVFIVFVLVRVL